MKFLSVILCVLGGSIRAAEPLFETQRLFALTPKNKPNYRIARRSIRMAATISPSA